MCVRGGRKRERGEREREREEGEGESERERTGGLSRSVRSFSPTYFVSCNGPCAPKEKWHRKEHIIIITSLLDKQEDCQDENGDSCSSVMNVQDHRKAVEMIFGIRLPSRKTTGSSLNDGSCAAESVYSEDNEKG